MCTPSRSSNSAPGPHDPSSSSGSLLFAAQVPCLVCLAAQAGTSFGNDTVMTLCLWMCLWTTLHEELWKRKESELVWAWDLVDFEYVEKPRLDFHGPPPCAVLVGLIPWL